MVQFRMLNTPVLVMYLCFSFLPLLTGQQQGEYPTLSNFDQVTSSQIYEEQIAYSIAEKPFGSGYASWCEAWVKHIYSTPCDQNPLAASTENRNDHEQVGPVFFLAGTLGGTIERTATISATQGIFFPVLNYVATYPCPYAGFKPAPGQSLKDFLMRKATEMVDQGTHMSVTLDDMRISDLIPYRVTTELFYFNALPELTCLDACVTGELHPAQADGYWIMLRPLAPGQHKLQYKASYPKVGWVMDVMYYLNVE